MTEKWANKVIAEQITGDDGFRVYKVRDQLGRELELPSVTTITSRTKSERDRKVLDDWKERVGQEEADRIRDTAIATGTAMHDSIEKFLETGESTGNDNYKQYYDGFLSKYNIEACLIEKPLYYYDDKLEIGFAGTVDLIAIVDGELMLIDHKSSTKKKREEWIGDYKMQVSAYAKAASIIYNVEIKKARINIATSKSFQYFELDEHDLHNCWKDFEMRMLQFNNKVNRMHWEPPANVRQPVRVFLKDGRILEEEVLKIEAVIVS